MHFEKKLWKRIGFRLWLCFQNIGKLHELCSFHLQQCTYASQDIALLCLSTPWLPGGFTCKSHIFVPLCNSMTPLSHIFVPLCISMTCQSHIFMPLCNSMAYWSHIFVPLCNSMTRRLIVLESYSNPQKTQVFSFAMKKILSVVFFFVWVVT